MGLCARQPFFLDVPAATATAASDAEATLPRQIRRDGGVPLGVDEDLPLEDGHVAGGECAER